MSREYGEPYGLPPDEDGLVPLSLSSAVVTSPNGSRAGVGLDDEPATARSVHLGAGDFTPERMIRATPDAPTAGWRRAIFALSGGLIAVGPGPEEIRQRELIARV